MSHIDTTSLFWAGTALWVVLWAVFIARLAWLDARLRAHLTEHHSHRWRRLSWSQRLTWSVWFVFQSKEDGGRAGQPMIAPMVDGSAVTGGEADGNAEPIPG
jgi:hypothetical protein